MKLTILAPLLGTFLLFNQNTVDLFHFDQTFLQNIGVRPDGSEISSFTIVNIYFLYFGLCALGFGSFLFNAFCPDEIKLESFITTYIANVRWSENAVVAKSKLQFVLDAYFKENRNVERDFSLATPEYPLEVEQDFYNLISEMFSKTDYQGTPSSDANAEDEHSGMGEVYFATGYPNIHEIARMVWSSPKAIWAFTLPFKDLSQDFAKDIAYVEFKTLNYSSFKIRLWIAALYVIGFLLLLKPTAETFFRLAINTLA